MPEAGKGVTGHDPEMLKAMERMFPRNVSNGELMGAVEALHADVRKLLKVSEQMSSILLTGEEVIKEYKEMVKKGK